MFVRSYTSGTVVDNWPGLVEHSGAFVLVIADIDVLPRPVSLLTD